MKAIIIKISILSLIVPLMLGCSKTAKEAEHTKGKWVFYSIRNKGNGLFLYRDGNLKFLREKTGLAVWSPNGKIIASEGASQESYEECKFIYLFDEYGNKIRDINTPVGVKYLDWSPDGKKIYYIGYPSREVNLFHPYLIYVYDFETDKHTKIFEGEKEDAFVELRCSPKGDKLIFRNTITYNPENKAREGLYIIDVNGDNLKRISKNAGLASWFPDGENICVLTRRDAEGNELIPGSGTKSYFKYNLKTKEYTKLIPARFELSVGNKISRDGKYLYFATGGGEGRVITVIPLEGPDKGKRFHVVPEGTYGYDGYPDWWQG